MATASGRERPWRTLANLTSMGRLIPASTSTFGRLIQEMARFAGVPPIMSVRIATPSPLSTRFIASMMSDRDKHSARIAMASICCCGPMICSSAALNSTASPHWDTSTRPIIKTSVLSDIERCPMKAAGAIQEKGAKIPSAADPQRQTSQMRDQPETPYLKADVQVLSSLAKHLGFRANGLGGPRQAVDDRRYSQTMFRPDVVPCFIGFVRVG